MSQLTIFGVIRIVHMHDRAHEMWAADELLHFFLAHEVGQDRGAVAIMEQILVAADAHYFGVFRHRPERRKALGFDQRYRIMAAQPGKYVSQRRQRGVRFRIDDGAADIGRDIQNAHDFGPCVASDGDSDAITMSTT